MKTQFLSKFNGSIAIASLLFLAPVCGHGQSLWSDQNSSSMFSDKKAAAIGDIVTVLVEESNSATKNNNTTTAKQTGVDASISSFLYPVTASGLLTKKGSL